MLRMKIACRKHIFIGTTLKIFKTPPNFLPSIMGCAHSSNPNLPQPPPTMFKARNLNDKDKTMNTVLLESKLLLKMPIYTCM